MSFVSGNSQSVRELQEFLKKTMQSIESDVSSLDGARNEVVGAWEDAGIEDVNEAINSIKSALENAKSSAPAVEKALEAYASFLEAHGK